MLAVSVSLILVGLIMLISSAVQRQASEEADEEMRAIYHAKEETAALTPVPGAAPTAEPAIQYTEKPTEAPAPVLPAETVVSEMPAEAAVSEIPAETAAPTPSPVPRLEEQGYPQNPGRRISARFRPLREKNKDVIGWLQIGKIVDEAVVQRDNEYYMDHNVKEQEDASGTLFLDAIVSLETRPYVLILYGHNMRNGSRFGSLRNYENQSFYHRNPFVTFDTMYEEGTYVVFSVGTVSTEESDPHYLDFYALNSRRIDERRQSIETLQAVSIYSNTVDIAIDDQVLLLVTCMGKDEDRRIVAARRIREGENRNDLKALVEKSKKR